VIDHLWAQTLTCQDTQKLIKTDFILIFRERTNGHANLLDNVMRNGNHYLSLNTKHIYRHLNYNNKLPTSHATSATNYLFVLLIGRPR
jgi:uncharacterized pyridoxamine 5'-phosphate oxidase family protein